jgi:hypothetical protein
MFVVMIVGMSALNRGVAGGTPTKIYWTLARALVGSEAHVSSRRLESNQKFKLEHLKLYCQLQKIIKL